MAEQWYYRMFDEEFGPMPIEELKQLADFGTISATDEVRLVGSGNWVSAASLDQLGLGGDCGQMAVVTCEDSGAEIKVTALKQPTDEWFCKLGGQELGPLSFDDLSDYVEHQQLSADDEVKLGEHGKWRRVGSIGRLMAVIPYQAAERTIVPTAAKSTTPAAEFPVATDDAEAAIEMELLSPSAPPPVMRTRAAEAKSDPVISTSARRTPVDAVPAVHRRSEPSRHTESAERPQASPYSSPLAAPSMSTAAWSAGVGTATKPKKQASSTRNSGPSRLSGLLENLKEPKAIGSIAAIGIVLLVFGWNYLPKSRGADIKRYQALKQIQKDILAKRSNPAERAALKPKAIAAGKEIANALKKLAGSDDLAKQSLLWAARDDIPRIFDGTPDAQQLAERSFADRLQEAGYLLQLEKRPAVPVVAQGAPLPDD